MEDKNHIDELFQTGLNQDFPVDDNLWAQVESQLPTSGRKGLWIFNLNSLAIMAILSISMILKSDTAETKQIAVQNILESELNSEQLIEQEEVIPAQQKSISDLSKPESKIENFETKNTKTAYKTIEENKTKEEIIKAVKEELAPVESSKVAENKIEVSSIQPDISIKTKQRISIEEELSVGEILVEENNSQTELEEEAPNNKSFTFEQLNFLDPSSLNTMNSSLVQKPIDKKNFWNSKRKQYYYYEIESNRSLNVDKQVSGLAPEIASYKSERENGGSNSTFGLNILTDHKFLQFGIGIRFSKYTEALKYSIDENGIGYDISFDTNYTVVNGNFNSNGELVLLIHTEIERIETEKGIIVKKNLFFRNEFERLQVPLLVGIHKNYGRFYGNLRASILLNYSIQQTGAYIGNDLNSIQNFEASKQINQFVIGNGYAASLGYSLNEFVVLGARFNYETDLTSFTKGYNSRFNQYGLGFWLMWKPR